jgi:hypothetical protein
MLRLRALMLQQLDCQQSEVVFERDPSNLKLMGTPDEMGTTCTRARFHTCGDEVG